MKSIFERLSILIKTWLWERKIAKNVVLSTRELSPGDSLTFNPYQSDYRYLIFQYCDRNKHIFRGDEEHPFVFQLYLNDGKMLLGFPVQFSNNLLTLKREKSEQDGYHTALTEEFGVHLCTIKQISAFRAWADFQAVYVKEPIFGYKAIEESNGELRAYAHTYKLNKPYVQEIRNPYNTEFQDCYFHFCTSMEGVSLCPGSTGHLTTIKDYAEGRAAARLFRVKAEDHCLERNGNLDWWVTNKITVLEEVSKEEIYQYYMENPRARERVEKSCKLTPDFWDEFLKSPITPYVEK